MILLQFSPPELCSRGWVAWQASRGWVATNALKTAPQWGTAGRGQATQSLELTSPAANRMQTHSNSAETNIEIKLFKKPSILSISVSLGGVRWF